MSSQTAELIALRLKFWLYIVFLIPSIICALLLLIEFLSDRTLRHSLSNHMIIFILSTVLFCQFTMYPWMLHYFNQDGIWYRSFAFCVVWGFIDWAIYMLQLLLFAWTSIERHILIFHDKFVSTRRRRILFHYLPPLIITLYWILFYTFVYFYPSCENIYDTELVLCATACLFNDFKFRAFETFFNNILPNFIIIAASLTLIVRIFLQRSRMNQPLRWRKHRKMTIQLVSVSAMYLLVTSPWALIIFLRMCGWSTYTAEAWDYYAFFISYYIVLLFPFFVVFSLPGYKQRLEKYFCFARLHRLVAPAPRPIMHNQHRE